MDSDENDRDFVNPPWLRVKKRKRSGKISKKKTRKIPKKQKQWWKIDKSRVTRDPRFEEKPVGLGVFTTRRIGRKKIYFNGEFKCKTHMAVWERDYGIETDYPNYIITPTDHQIRTGNL